MSATTNVRSLPEAVASMAPALPEWVTRAAPGSASVTWLRVSANDAAESAANARAAAALADRPGLRRLDSVGGAEAVVEQPERWPALGITALRRRNASPYAESPERLMGLLWPSEDDRELLVMLHDSAASGNIVIPGDLVPRNATTEIAVQLAALPAVGSIHVGAWDRLVRDATHGQRLTAVLTSQRVVLFEGAQERDLHSAAAALLTQVSTGMSSGERAAGRTRTTKGVIRRLQAGLWPQKPYALPPGWAVDTGEYVDAHGRTRTDGEREGRVIPDEANREALSEVFRAIAAGADWPTVAAIAAKHRLPTRDGSGRTLDQLPAHAQTASVYQYVHGRGRGRSNLETLLTRRYVSTREIPVHVPASATTWEGLTLDPDTGSGVRTITVDVEWPEPAIDLTPDEWAALAARMETRRSRERTGATDLRMPLVPGPDGRWVEGGREHQITSRFNAAQGAGQSGYNSYYQVRSRPMPDPYRGWHRSDVDELLLSVRAADADRAVGVAIEDAVADMLDLQAAPVQIPTRSTATEALLTQHRDQLAEVIEDLEDAVLVNVARPSERRQARVTTLQNDRSRLETLIAEAETSSPAPADLPEAGLVDLTSLAGVVAALQTEAGKTTDRRLNDSVRSLVGGTLRITLHPDNPRIAVITATVSLPADGATITLPVRAEVRNSGISRLDGDLADALITAVLRDGESLPDALDRLTHESPDPPLAAVLNRLVARLAGPGGMQWSERAESQRKVARRVARAAIDCPIPSTRQILWSMLAETPPPADVDPRWTEHVTDAYRSLLKPRRRKLAWWAGRLQNERRVLEAIRTAMSRSGTPVDPREGIAATDLARVCGWMREKGQTPNPQVVMLLTPEATGRRVGVPVLERVDSPGHEALVRPHICDVCDRPMLWVINTVELAGSVCEHCRVVPGTDIPIPDGYFEYWESAEHPEITRVGSRIAGKSEYVGHGSGRPIQPRKVGMTEAAQLAGISTATLHRMATDGRITATKEPGQGRRFDPAEMRALREAGVGTGDVTRTAADRDYITLGAAAERLGVKDNTVRRRAQATGPDEGPVRYRVVPYGERRTTLLVHREDIDKLVSDPAARLDALGDPSSDDDWVNLTDGAALLGMNVATLNRHLDAAGDEALIRSKTVPWGQGKTRMLVHRDDIAKCAVTDEWLSLPEASDQLDMSTDGIRKRALATDPDEGPLRYRTVPYGASTRILVHREDVDALMPPAGLITPQEAAELLGWSPQTVRRRAQATGPDEGPVRYTEVPFGAGTRLMVHRDDIEQFIQN